jgi:hypothetical protein
MGAACRITATLAQAGTDRETSSFRLTMNGKTRLIGNRFPVV